MTLHCSLSASIGLVIVLLRLSLALGDDNDSGNLSSGMREQSIVGCMTTSCHGSNVQTAAKWQRAGKIWFDQDPHAQAYTVLLNDNSARIVSHLINSNEVLTSSSKKYLDILEAKCVSCHASENAPKSKFVLGADCQVCHGSADAWGSEHYSSEWKDRGKRRFDDKKKIDVESLVSRAQVCSSCHVGELNRKGPDQQDRLDREVDHKLMAAGHPPMVFDFESFMRRYPVHWDTKDEEVGIGASIGFERWRIGKITAAITRLKLLTARAERATSQSASPHDWPELTEYSCTSCHHALVQPSWRQTRGANSIAVWDEWSTSQLGSAIRDQSVGELTIQIKSLKDLIETISPKPNQVAMKAVSFRRWLEIELDQVSSTKEDLLDVMLPKLQKQAENVTKLRSWESAAQWYIATRVLAEGLGMEGSPDPAPLLFEDPFAGSNKTWKPFGIKEFNAPSQFHPDMLENYHSELVRQLRKRP